MHTRIIETKNEYSIIEGSKTKVKYWIPNFIEYIISYIDIKDWIMACLCEEIGLRVFVCVYEN